MLALCAAMAGGLLALLSSVIAASTVYLVLVALSGLSAVVVWIAIAYCQIVFRRRWLESGHSTSELKYRTPGYPYVSWAAFILCTASFVLVIFDVEQRFALVAELVFIVACYGAYFLQQWYASAKRRPRPTTSIRFGSRATERLATYRRTAIRAVNVH